MPKSVLRGGVCGNIGETGDLYNFFPLSPKNSPIGLLNSYGEKGKNKRRERTIGDY